MRRVLLSLLLRLTTVISRYSNPPSDTGHIMSLDALFRYTTSRNHQVMTQAIDLVHSMQNAPTCTRMAASHLMKECNLLEHAPEFVRSQPAAYLDNVKTEYAAKLAVCELMSAQPNNPRPPTDCEILVPSADACDKSRRWWHARPEKDLEHTICYPDFKEHHYGRCLRALQSSPQYWTSFSNARQNAVVMCQASRDAIERESHLETFKNLTSIVGMVSDTIQRSFEEYGALLQERKVLVDDLHTTHDNFKRDILTLQKNALATIRTVDERLQNFLGVTMRQFTTALADNQSKEISQIQRRMESFSGDITNEILRTGSHFRDQFQTYHEEALLSMKLNHEAQTESHSVLSAQLEGLKGTAIEISAVTNSSMDKIATIEQRLIGLTDHAEDIANRFALFATLPQLLARMTHGILAVTGFVFLFAVLDRFNRRFAIYCLGAMGFMIILQTLGINKQAAFVQLRVWRADRENSIRAADNLALSWKTTIHLLMACTCAYPISQILVRLGLCIRSGFHRTFAQYWLSSYANDAGMGLLPNVEIPIQNTACQHALRSPVLPFGKCQQSQGHEHLP